MGLLKRFCWLTLTTTPISSRAAMIRRASAMDRATGFSTMTLQPWRMQSMAIWG